MLSDHLTYKDTERGNALFLILIAVVLFAALSFAITQSNRSTGSSAGEDTNTVSGSNVTQYASAVRTGITRMLVRGHALEDLLFDMPGETAYDANVARQAFHPQGGAIVFQDPDTNLVAEGGGKWVFFFAEVKDMATDAADAVAVLTNVRRGVCQQINRNVFGSTAINALGTAGLTKATLEAATFDSASEIGNNFNFGSTPNKPYGCFSTDSGAVFHYMHVLAEQ
jgi:hypothetical protein